MSNSLSFVPLPEHLLKKIKLLEKYVNYIFENSNDAKTKKYFNIKKLNCVILPSKLLEHAFKTEQYEKLTQIVNIGISIKSADCYLFIINNPSYLIWLRMSSALKVHRTYIMESHHGSNASDKILNEFYDDLIKDVTEPILLSMVETQSLYMCDKVLSHMFQYIFENFQNQSVKDFISNKDYLNDYELMTPLIAYAVNYEHLQALKHLIDNGLIISNYNYYMFITEYPSYYNWKDISKVLGVKPTCVIGAYDIDDNYIFYQEMIKDLGKEEILRSIREDDHDYAFGRLISMIEDVNNCEKLSKLQVKTGLPCPKMDN